MDKQIKDVLKRYYDEAVGGVVQKSPSTLSRGEATEIEYYIYKIDLVNSTPFIKSKTHQTYLKLVHTFLSAVDEITCMFGADKDQTEYAGNSVLVYFRAKNVEPISVLEAACYCRLAALEMRNLDPTLRLFPFRTKTIIHYGKLLMAKIGPRGNWQVTAIGPELHKACKMEKSVGSGAGRASIEFRDQLDRNQRLLLKANYNETKVLKQPDPIPKLWEPSIDNYLSLLNSSTYDMHPPAVTAPQYEIQQEIVDYSIRWDILRRFVEVREANK